MPDPLLAALVVALALLATLELRRWWRPLPPPGSLERRLQPLPERSRRRRWLNRPQGQQALLLGLAGGVAIFLLLGLWWAGLAAALVVAALAAWQLPGYHRRRRAEKARAELQLALGQLGIALRAGDSLATALHAWPQVVAQALGPGKWVLPPELQRVCADLERGATPEEALAALAGRLQLEELRMLAHVIRLCRSRGGDLSQVVSQSTALLADSLEVQAQMQSLTAGKRAEGLVLTLLPPAVLLLITVSNPGYIAPLLHSNAGRLVLTLALVLEAACFFASRWLLQPRR